MPIPMMSIDDDDDDDDYDDNDDDVMIIMVDGWFHNEYDVCMMIM
jgi:hypothetical protein